VDIGEQIRFVERNLDAVESRASASFEDSKLDREEKANLRAVLKSLRLVPKLLKVVEAARGVAKEASIAIIFDNAFQNRVAAMRIALAALDAGEGGK